MHLTSHITHSNGYAPCIAYYRSNGVDQLFRKLKPKPKLNPPNAHRSPIKIWHTHNVQFPFMPNAFRILKPIQKSSKRVWVFHNTGANAFAKNQMRLAYEDKRDLYCIQRSHNVAEMLCHCITLWQRRYNVVKYVFILYKNIYFTTLLECFWNVNHAVIKSCIPERSWYVVGTFCLLFWKIFLFIYAIVTFR